MYAFRIQGMHYSPSKHKVTWEDWKKAFNFCGSLTLQIIYILPKICCWPLRSSLLVRVNTGRDMCFGQLHLQFTWNFTWPMPRTLNSTLGPLLSCLLTYHSFQLEELRNAKNVLTFCFTSDLSHALRKCCWPPMSRLVCGRAKASPQLWKGVIKHSSLGSHLWCEGSLAFEQALACKHNIKIWEWKFNRLKLEHNLRIHSS